MKKEVLLLFLISGLVLLMNGCAKEKSFENGNGPSEGTLQADGLGDCLPKTVSGTYVLNTALDGTTNYIEVQVDVTGLGAYVIYTDTLNGMYFRASGVFSDSGLVTIRLKGFGTPTAAGTHDFTVQYGTSACVISVTTVNTLAVFTLSGAPDTCMNYVVAGTYTVGTALTSANTVTINVNVTTAGAYNITTLPSNGMVFTGSGILATGAQTITLTAAGSTPTTSGIASVPVSAGSTSCSFKVNVGGSATAATYTINCPATVVNGTYTVNTVLNGSTNTITLSVNVAVAGTYTISGSINNMTFSGSGSFAASGNGQTVTLTGSGTPNTAGANIVPLTGGTTPCNVPVNVNPASGGAAVFTVDCSTANLGGYLTAGVPIATVNAITINVNVATAGTYTISTVPINGITYTATGTFSTTGIQSVTLSGVGSTPTNAGTFTLQIQSGTTPCSFTVDVDPNYGSWTFKVGTTTYSGTIYDVGFDNTILPAPATLFILLGDNAAGDLFEIDLADVNGTIVTNESYNCAAAAAVNAGGVYFDGVTGTTYYADPSFPTNTMSVVVTSHNAATKTMTGTFTGKAILNGGTTLADITNGQFTVTYP